MPQNNFDLVAASRREMLDQGFLPDIPAEAQQQVDRIHIQPDPSLRDLTNLLWSSIDNDDSRDLDQIEWAERAGGKIRVLVAIADVDSAVAKGTPVDRYASRETTTVYAGPHTFSMLPERLSTDLTSLSEGGERAAVVIEFAVASDGSFNATAFYRARVRNHAQLTYNAVGAWLEGKAAAPPKVAASPELQAQLKLQDEAAQQLREARHRLGALTFDRVEAQPVMTDGHVTAIAARVSNRAAHLIEDFMIAANETMAQSLQAAGVSSIRRVVKAPERWARIVALAEGLHEKLPPEPDAGALDAFLVRRKAADPLHYEDLSLSVLKLMGPGEYVLSRSGDAAPGHFGLAAHDYTHSTAPNRRFADLVAQRLVKALIEHTPAHAPAPYTDEELDAIARNCTLREDAARKVQRNMLKRMAAVALAPRVGATFDAVVTGATPKGVFVRVLDPPVEGRVMRGEQGLDVGDRLRVKLIATDPERGFIDFGKAS
jgi:VacB/RNase II family 3'-5' exoribonuclease